MTGDIRQDVVAFIHEQDLDGLCDYIRSIQYLAFKAGLAYPQPRITAPASCTSPNPTINGDSK